MSSVKHLLADKIKTILTAACITNIAADDPTRVDFIGIRKVTGNYRITLTIQHFDPIQREAHSDESVGKSPRGEDGYLMPPRDNSGTTYERIQGTVMVACNLTGTKETTELADEYVQEVVARVKNALRKNKSTLTGFADTYGERVATFEVTGSAQYDSGAEIANVTRDFVRWTALTAATPV